MNSFLRFLLLLALAVWIGGIIFFSAVEAPIVLHYIADRQLGGAMISQSLRSLHFIGIACGLIFLIISLRLSHVTLGKTKAFQLSNLLVLAMLGLTLISQSILLPLATLRRTGLQSAESVAQFQRLHNWSVGLEMGVLLFGVALVYFTARRLS